MSFTWSNMVWASPEPHGADRLCLSALADYADDNGYCYPSQATLAQKCAVGKRAIQYTLDRLEAGGYIRVEHRSGTSSVYWIIAKALTPEADCQGQGVVAHEAHCGGTDEADCVAPPEVHCQPPTKPTATEPPMNHQLEPPTEPLRSVGSKNGKGSMSAVATIVAQLRAAGEKDPDLEDKVASLAAQNGSELVAGQCDGLTRQYAGTSKGFGFGLLVKAVKHPGKFRFVEAPRVAGTGPPARPAPGTSRTIEQAAALDAAGVTTPEDWQRRGAGDFVIWYVPPNVLRDDPTSSIPTIPRNVSGGGRAAKRCKSGPLVNFLQSTQNGGGID